MKYTNIVQDMKEGACLTTKIDSRQGSVMFTSESSLVSPSTVLVSWPVRNKHVKDLPRRCFGYSWILSFETSKGLSHWATWVKQLPSHPFPTHAWTLAGLPHPVERTEKLRKEIKTWHSLLIDRTAVQQWSPSPQRFSAAFPVHSCSCQLTLWDRWQPHIHIKTAENALST